MHAFSRQQFYEGDSRRVAVVAIRPGSGWGGGGLDKELHRLTASGQDGFKNAPVEKLCTKCYTVRKHVFPQGRFLTSRELFFAWDQKFEDHS